MKKIETKILNGITVIIEKELLEDMRTSFNKLAIESYNKILSDDKEIIDENTIRFLHYNPVLGYTFYIEVEYELTGFNNNYLYITNAE